MQGEKYCITQECKRVLHIKSENTKQNKNKTQFWGFHTFVQGGKTWNQTRKPQIRLFSENLYPWANTRLPVHRNSIHMHFCVVIVETLCWVRPYTGGYPNCPFGSSHVQSTHFEWTGKCIHLSMAASSTSSLLYSHHGHFEIKALSAEVAHANAHTSNFTQACYKIGICTCQPSLALINTKMSSVWIVYCFCVQTSLCDRARMGTYTMVPHSLSKIVIIIIPTKDLTKYHTFWNVFQIIVPKCCYFLLSQTLCFLSKLKCTIIMNYNLHITCIYETMCYL